MASSSVQIAASKTKYGFSFVTTSAYHLKILSELLKSNLVEENARINKDGLFIRGADAKERTLIDVELHASSLDMEVPEEEVEVGIVFSHLYDVMRRITRKDSVSIARVAGTDQLDFTILNADKGRDKDAFIRLKDIKTGTPWGIPEFKNNVICTIPAVEFQRMTKENSKTKYINIKIQANGVKFVTGTSQLNSMGDRFGKYKDSDPPLYDRYFETKQLTKLAKVNGLASNNFLKLHCCPEDEESIMLESAVGLVGKIRIVLLPVPVDQAPKP